MQQGLVIAFQRRGRFRGEDLDYYTCRLCSRITLFKVQGISTIRHIRSLGSSLLVYLAVSIHTWLADISRPSFHGSLHVCSPCPVPVRLSITRPSDLVL